MNRRFFIRLLSALPFIGLFGFVKPTEHGIPDPTEGIRAFREDHRYYRETIHCGYTIKDGHIHLTDEQMKYHNSGGIFKMYLSGEHHRMLTEYYDD